MAPNLSALFVNPTICSETTWVGHNAQWPSNDAHHAPVEGLGVYRREDGQQNNDHCGS